MRRSRKLMFQILKTTGAHRILWGFLITFFVSSILIWKTEPTITTLGDSIWYCFTAVTTIGFGDQCATIWIPRLITIVLSIYSIIVFAILTAMITDLFIEYMRHKSGEDTQELLKELENVAEMSQDERAALQAKARELLQRAKDFDKDK
ncbi:MAG: potassium channel family protein [Lachnospiraceae bacterium]|nr:potassium channel family protein [Lachnospiraceae bacterium]